MEIMSLMAFWVPESNILTSFF